MKKKQTKQLRVSLNSQDAQYLQEISKMLDVKETEILRQGLRLMSSLYMKTKNPKKTSIILKEDDIEKEIIVL